MYDPSTNRNDQKSHHLLNIILLTRIITSGSKPGPGPVHVHVIIDDRYCIMYVASQSLSHQKAEANSTRN